MKKMKQFRLFQSALYVSSLQKLFAGPVDICVSAWLVLTNSQVIGEVKGSLLSTLTLFKRKLYAVPFVDILLFLQNCTYNGEQVSI